MNSTVQLLPFGDEFLTSAAELLAARHRRDRLAVPALPVRFEDPLEAHKAVEAAWRRPWVNGVAAFHGDQLIAYLFADAQFDQLLGRTAWVRVAGHALAEHIDPDFYKELYAAAAPAWLALGCFSHYVHVMTAGVDWARALLDVWYALSFGQQQAYGLRPLQPEDGREPDPHPGFSVRRAIPADREAFASMALLNATYQAQSPVWAPLPAEIAAERPRSYASVLDDAEAMLWLAIQGEQLAAFQIYYPAEPAADALYIPDRCAELPAAATLAEWRGQGMGRILSQYSFKHLVEQGYQYCLADWRTTNLLASRAWPRLGFQPVMHRLHRVIDARVLWAKG